MKQVHTSGDAALSSHEAAAGMIEGHKSFIFFPSRSKILAFDAQMKECKYYRFASQSEVLN